MCNPRAFVIETSKTMRPDEFPALSPSLQRFRDNFAYPNDKPSLPLAERGGLARETKERRRVAVLVVVVVVATIGERRRAAAALLNRQRRIPWRGDKGVRRGMEKREEEEEEERAPRASGASSAASSIYPWWVPPVPSPPVSFALCLRQEGEEGVVSRGERASRVRASGEVSRT